jgi:hypothetical protein
MRDDSPGDEARILECADMAALLSGDMSPQSKNQFGG